jgi:hypothetical protein
MTLPELIDALEKAKRPSRELDTQLWLAITKGATRNSTRVTSSTGAWGPYNIDETRDATGALIIVPAFTASVDAAIALCERVLPEHGWELASKTSHILNCLNPEYGKPIGKYPHWAAVAKISSKKFEDGATPAIALCIAILKALQETSND